MNCHLDRVKFKLDVCLSLEPGSVLAITGENGSGKTSTLDMIAGLVACSSGKISFGTEVFDDSTTAKFVQPELRGVATVFQGGGLFSHLSVKKNILFGRGAMFKDSEQFVRVTEQFNLTSLLSRRPATLSGGQRQRVALARAFLAPSRILLLDEPTTSLDTNTRDEVRKSLKEMFTNYDGMVILVSHDAEEISELATKIAPIKITQSELTHAVLEA